ncbi:MAG: hypothetical protein Q9187_006847, partial [Circinaria calcarea]
RKEDKNTISFGEDPDNQAEESAKKSKEARYIDTSSRVTEDSHNRATKTLPEVEEGAYDRSLLGGETHAQSVIGKAE